MVFSQVNRLFIEMERNRPELGRHCFAVAQCLRSVTASLPVAKVGASSEDMAAASMLHDYAKILWAPALFVKVESDLSLNDLEIISSHPMVGRRLISNKWPRCPETVLKLIETHHCPGGWAPAQLLAACDVWVACHEARLYRRRAVPERFVPQEMLRVVPEWVVNLVLDVLKSESSCESRTNSEYHAISF